MHDGSIPHLDRFSTITRPAAEPPRVARSRANRSKNLNKNPFVGGFSLTTQQRADLPAFLESLTDTEFLTGPRFSDPGSRNTGTSFLDREVSGAELGGMVM
jgi:cytochrome c peroxidase